MRLPVAALQNAPVCPAEEPTQVCRRSFHRRTDNMLVRSGVWMCKTNDAQHSNVEWSLQRSTLRNVGSIFSGCVASAKATTTICMHHFTHVGAASHGGKGCCTGMCHQLNDCAHEQGRWRMAAWDQLSNHSHHICFAQQHSGSTDAV